MPLTEGDKAICRDIAREIVQEVLAIHVSTCPHGRTMFKMIWMSIGIAVGSGIAGGSVAVAVIKALGI